MTKKRSCFKTAYFDLEMLSKGFNLNYYYKEVKMNYSKIAFSCFILFFCTSLFAGPFGLEMGMSLKDIGKEPLKGGVGNYYMFKELPKPHSAFNVYLLQIAPKEGLYSISAMGKYITCSPDGFQLKNAFNNLKETLENNYGKCVMLEKLSAGSIWDEPGDWMMSIAKEHRFYMASWDKDESLPPDLKKIILSVSATSQNSGFVILRYDFINSDSCSTKMSAEENNAL